MGIRIRWHRKGERDGNRFWHKVRRWGGFNRVHIRSLGLYFENEPYGPVVMTWKYSSGCRRHSSRHIYNYRYIYIISMASPLWHNERCFFGSAVVCGCVGVSLMGSSCAWMILICWIELVRICAYIWCVYAYIGYVYVPGESGRGIMVDGGGLSFVSIWLLALSGRRYIYGSLFGKHSIIVDCFDNEVTLQICKKWWLVNEELFIFGYHFGCWA